MATMKEMSAPSAGDIKVFVPAKDISQSMQFYEAMGWKVNWRAEDDGLAQLELAGNRVYLQNYASRVIEEGGYEDAWVREPQEQSYGALVTFVWDPCGVLLHCAEYRGG